MRHRLLSHGAPYAVWVHHETLVQGAWKYRYLERLLDWPVPPRAVRVARPRVVGVVLEQLTANLTRPGQQHDTESFA